MNKGWQNVKISDLCEVIAGQSPQGKFYNTDRRGMPFYQGKKDFGEKYIENPTTWTTQITKIARDGDILMSVRAPVGPVNFATEEVCIGRGLAAIRSRAELNRDFLFYQLLYLQPAIAGKEGAVFASINKSEIEALPLVFAPLPEQQRIVGILDESFDGIATAKANAEKNVHNACTLFNSHLQSVFTQRSEGWVETTLESCCEQIFAGGDVPKDRVSRERTPEYSIPIFSNGAKDDGLYGFTDVARVTKPSITVSARGTLGFTAIRTNPFFPVVRLIVLIPDEKHIELSFLYYAVVGMDFGNTGTSIPQLTVPNLKDCKLHLPPLSVQRAIVDKLDALSEETQHLESIYQQKLTALEELKKSLLHRAFIGEL